MNKFAITFSIIVIAASSAFFGYKSYHEIQLQDNFRGNTETSLSQTQRTQYNMRSVKNITTALFVMKASTIFIFGFIWFGIVLVLYFKKRKNFVYLLLFTIFYIYLYKVIDYTLFQFQSLILLQHFVAGLVLHGQTAGKSMNFIPLITLQQRDLKTSLLNILLMIPFGFGLPFISNFRPRKVIVIGLLFSIGIELLQLITGLIAKITFRIADINDVIFNTLGVVVGCILFIAFTRIYYRIFRNRILN